MADIHGTINERFAAMHDLLSHSIDIGHDLGASVAVVVDGEFVVDIWGGWTDETHTKPWQQDTITNVWSSTKTMMALTALLAIDRGLLDPHAPVADLWPEFGVVGKENITLAHMLSHTSGVSGWEQPVQPRDVIDVETAVAKLATQSPWWEPGTAGGYHAISQGHLVGEMVRRATGSTLGQYFASEIAGPLGADFHIGLPDEHHHRVSDVIYPGTNDIEQRLADSNDPESIMHKTFGGPQMNPAMALTPEWRRAEIPAANGHGNAHSVALVQSIVANGGVAGGKQFLSKETLRMIFDEQSNGNDLVTGRPVRRGIGYGLADPVSTPYLPDRRICYWGGWGGSLVIVDTDRRMVVTYMMNKMRSSLLGDLRGVALVMAAFAAV